MPSCTVNVTGEDIADFIYRHNSLTPEEISEVLGTPCIQYVNREYAVAYAPLDAILPLTIERHTYSSIPKLFTLLDTTSMEASGILPVFNQPALNTGGNGVIIGLIDTGIEYQNPLFQKADGTTRILDIWDQTIPGEPFSIPALGGDYTLLYGTHYTEAQINEALASPDPLFLVPSVDTDGHGTFLAGIAGGGATETRDFTGAAPECSFAIVKLKPAKQYLRDFYLINEDAPAFQENDIMTGIMYLVILAGAYGMPLVVYSGVGTNQGSHDGSSPLSRIYQHLGIYQGVGAVCAAGNEVGFRQHYLGQMSQNQEYDEVEIRVAPGENGFTLELWTTPPEIYTVGFVSPTGEIIQRIPIILGTETLITFSLEETVITLNYRLSPSETEGQLIFMRVQAPTAGIWRIRVYNSIFINGVYHMWLPIHGFIQEDTIFLQADPYTTIVDPGTAALPVTVSTYNHLNGSLYIHSSRGYTRVNLIKPDIAAPGVDVYGPGLSVPAPDGATRYPMVRKTGSSVAAAHVAGAVANLLSWGIVEGNDPSINLRSIKSYLVQGANRNPNYAYPNREWGYGTLDLYQTFLSLRE